MLESFATDRQVPLTIGERLCDWPLLTSRGEAFSLYGNQIYGWPKALLLLPADAASGGADAVLRDFAAAAQALAETETHVVAISVAAPAENAALRARLTLPFSVLSDPEGNLHRAAARGTSDPAAMLLFDPVLRLERRMAAAEGVNLAAAVLDHMRGRRAAFPPAVVGAQPPVLVLPNVLDPDHCRRLMANWETGEKVRDLTASPSLHSNVAAPKSKVRADVILPEDSPTSLELVGVIGRRLLPEVERGLGFRVSRFEHFRIGCYDAGDGGHFAAHRDNTTKMTAHRRYALTLNLNSGEYQGGFLRFPEYGPQLYAPPPGGAVVFSCSLLHLATPVEQGRRFVVVGFFWGEAEQKIAEANLAELSRESASKLLR